MRTWKKKTAESVPKRKLLNKITENNGKQLNINLIKKTFFLNLNLSKKVEQTAASLDLENFCFTNFNVNCIYWFHKFQIIVSVQGKPLWM